MQISVKPCDDPAPKPKVLTIVAETEHEAEVLIHLFGCWQTAGTPSHNCSHHTETAALAARLFHELAKFDRRE